MKRFTFTCTVAWLGVLIVGGGARGAEAGKPGRAPKMLDAAGRYLEAGDDASRRRVAAELAAFRNVSKEEFSQVVAWLEKRHAAGYKPLKSGSHNRTAICPLMPKGRRSKEVIRNVELPYRVTLPKGYDPTRAYPCMIYVGGLSGANAFRGAGPGWIGMGVTVKCPYLFGRGLTFINCPLEHAMREFHIDPNRVYMGGFSAGGAYAFREAGINPDFYAGIMPCSAHTADTEMLNLRRMSIYMLHGETDANVRYGQGVKLWADSNGARCKLDILKGVGHSACSGRWKQAARWFADRPRPTYPREIGFWQRWWAAPELPSAGWRRHFWTYTFMKPKGGASDHDTVRMEATVHDQEVTVETDLDGLEVYLCDEMVDLDKPVKVTVNGRAMNRKFPRSLGVLLEYYHLEPHSGFRFAVRLPFGPARHGNRSLMPMPPYSEKRLIAVEASALERPAPPGWITVPEKGTEKDKPPLVRLNNHRPARRVTAWVKEQDSMVSSAIWIHVFHEVGPEGYELRDPTKGNRIGARKEGTFGHWKPVAAEIAKLSRLKVGSLVDIYYRLGHSGRYAVAYRVLRTIPPRGRITGLYRVFKRQHPGTAILKVQQAPKGAEHLKGCWLPLLLPGVKDLRRRTNKPPPSVAQKMATLKEHLIEVEYTADTRFRMLRVVKDLGPAPEGPAKGDPEPK